MRLEIPWQALGLARPPQELKANLFRHCATGVAQPVTCGVPTFGPLGRVERYATLTLAGP